MFSTTSLNYGLMLDKLQQKRQQRQQKNDGSMSDSNYATYGDLKQRSPYSWLQPASTYAASVQQVSGRGRAQQYLAKFRDLIDNWP